MKKITTLFLLASVPFAGATDRQVDLNSLQSLEKDGSLLSYFQGVPFTGKAVAKWPNGQKKTEVNYVKGRRHGLKAHWYESGKKLSQINYKFGKREGLLDVWYENGQPRRTGDHKNGNMTGVWVHWYENGQQRDEIFYKDGLLESATVWKPNGDKCFTSETETGNGIMIKYDDDGEAWLSVNYNNGAMTGWTRL